MCVCSAHIGAVSILLYVVKQFFIWVNHFFQLFVKVRSFYCSHFAFVFGSIFRKRQRDNKVVLCAMLCHALLWYGMHCLVQLDNCPLTINEHPFYHLSVSKERCIRPKTYKQKTEWTSKTECIERERMSPKLVKSSFTVQVENLP